MTDCCSQHAVLKAFFHRGSRHWSQQPSCQWCEYALPLPTFLSIKAFVLKDIPEDLETSIEQRDGNKDPDQGYVGAARRDVSEDPDQGYVGIGAGAGAGVRVSHRDVSEDPDQGYVGLSAARRDVNGDADQGYVGAARWEVN